MSKKNKKLNGFQLKQQKQQNEKTNTTDVLDIMIKKYGKKTISSKYQNEDMWFGDHKKVNDVSWVGMINNLSNETTFDLYMRNEETRNWWFELQGEMDLNQIPSDRFETEDEKQDYVVENETLVFGMVKWFRNKNKVEFPSNMSVNKYDNRGVKIDSMDLTQNPSHSINPNNMEMN